MLYILFAVYVESVCSPHPHPHPNSRHKIADDYKTVRGALIYLFVLFYRLLQLQMFYEVRRDISGSFIFMMSDGTDNISPTVNDVIQEVTSDGVVIASLPFSTNISENIIMNNTINQNFTTKDINQLYRLEDESRFQKVFRTQQ